LRLEQGITGTDQGFPIYYIMQSHTADESIFRAEDTTVAT